MVKHLWYATLNVENNFATSVAMIPSLKPRLSSIKLHEILDAYQIDRVKYPLVLVGIRGYYLNTMGLLEKTIVVYTTMLFLLYPKCNCFF